MNYNYIPPAKITVVVDSREKISIEFPKAIVFYTNSEPSKKYIIQIECRKRNLDFGDYTLLGYENIVAIERKGSVDEIVNNMLTTDRRRAITAFRRLASNVAFPILILDFNINAFFSGTRLDEYTRAYQELNRVVTSCGIEVWYTGVNNASVNRVKLGTALIYRLLACIEEHEKRINYTGVEEDVKEDKDETIQNPMG